MIQLAGAIGVLALLWLTVFQILLASGAPLGHLAWGGAQRVLPAGLRIASAAAAVFTLVGAGVLGQAAGLVPAWVPDRALGWALWAYALLFGISLVGNAASSSVPERLHGVPMTTLVAGSSLWLALAAH